MSPRIRVFVPSEHHGAVEALDTELRTDREFVVRRGAQGLELAVAPLRGPHRKRFPVDLSADPWTHGYVAVEGGVVQGFIATSIEAWNSRLVIRHFYVDAALRRRGIGRVLVAHACSLGREAGAVTAWVETSNRNYPGVQAYQRLGFSLCGFDLSLYAGTRNEGEFALFLSRDLRVSSR